MKVVKLSALCTGCLYPPGKIPGVCFFYKLSQPWGRNVVGRIMSMKNSNDTIRCCIRCGPDEECILDVVPREDGARNSG